MSDPAFALSEKECVLLMEALDAWIMAPAHTTLWQMLKEDVEPARREAIARAEAKDAVVAVRGRREMAIILRTKLADRAAEAAAEAAKGGQ